MGSRKHLVVGRMLAAFVLLGAGLASAVSLAGCGSGAAAGKISTAVDSLSVSRPSVTVTQPGSTISTTETEQQTQTVQQTVVAPVVVTPTTTSSTTDSSGTPAWVWVLVAVGAAGLIGLIVWLVRRGGSRELPIEERQRLVSATVASWVAQGWAIESQAEGSAVLQRDGQRVVVSVDATGRVTSGPLGAPAPNGSR
jgi:hypothetical protein